MSDQAARLKTKEILTKADLDFYISLDRNVHNV